MSARVFGQHHEVRAGVAVRAKPVKSVSTKARVISRARSARKFMKISASPSSIGTASPMRVALTNSSFSSRA